MKQLDMISEFSLNENERELLEEKMKELLRVCQILKIPMFACAAIENNKEGTVYNNITYGGLAHNVYLTDDQIQRHILVSNKFRVVPPRDEFTLDMTEVL